MSTPLEKRQDGSQKSNNSLMLLHRKSPDIETPFLKQQVKTSTTTLNEVLDYDSIQPRLGTHSGTIKKDLLLTATNTTMPSTSPNEPPNPSRINFPQWHGTDSERKQKRQRTTRSLILEESKARHWPIFSANRINQSGNRVPHIPNPVA